MGIPIATIASEGRRIDGAIELLAVEVRRELNRIPEAHLTFIDGSVAARTFAVSNAPDFEPGKRITVALRYEGDPEDTVVFEGLVLRHSVETRARGSVLQVVAKDAAFKLTRQRHSGVFRDQVDGDAIRKVLDDAHVDVGDIAPTKTRHEELIQYYASDWDFIVSRADVQGLVVDVHRGKVSVQPMVAGGAARVRIEYGIGPVLDFDLEVDGGTQWAAVHSAAWDVKKLERGAAIDASDPSVTIGDLDAAAIARKLGGEGQTLVHSGVAASGELAAWADGRLARSRLAMLRGRIGLDGRLDVVPRDLVELRGIGKRFDGKVLVSGVVHRVDHDGWRTELRIGLAPDWFARQPEIAEVPAAGLLPPVFGLQIGVVAKFESDPRGEHRVKVALAGLDAKVGAVWARVAKPDAGKQRGFVWWPEPGDEVLVGFLHGDPRQAVIVGGLHGSTNTAPDAVGGPSKANDLRTITTRSGLAITFDDKKKSVRVETPGKNRIVADDDAQSITLTDQHGNSITMDSKGITLKSAKDLKLDAGSGKVVIQATSVDVQ